MRYTSRRECHLPSTHACHACTSCRILAVTSEGDAKSVSTGYPKVSVCTAPTHVDRHQLCEGDASDGGEQTVMRQAVSTAEKKPPRFLLFLPSLASFLSSPCHSIYSCRARAVRPLTSLSSRLDVVPWSWVVLSVPNHRGSSGQAVR